MLVSHLPLSQAHQDFLVFSMPLMGDHLLGHFELLLTQVVYLYIPILTSQGVDGRS